MAAAFIQALPNALSLNNPNLTNAVNKDTVDVSDGPKYDHVRRPVRGVQIKQESFVTLEVKTRDGKNLLLFDGGGSVEKGDISYTPKYSNFLIQTISENSMEKSQVVETFGPAFVFYFGTRPRVFNISGLLLNSADFNWKNEWWANYETYLRGTQLVATNTMVYVSYEDTTLVGYLMSCSSETMADPNEYAPFQFQILISAVINTNIIGLNKFPYYTPVNIEPEVVVIQNSESPNIPQQSSADSVGVFSDYIQSILSGNASLDFLYGSRASTYTNYAVSYITGANIRIPIGATGSTVFDTNQTPVYKYGTFQGYKTTEVQYGKLRDNTDEYVAMTKNAGTGGTLYVNTPSAREQQYIEGMKQDEIAKKQFKQYGIDTEPPNRLKQLAVTSTFASLQLAGNLVRMNSKSDPLADLLGNKNQNDNIQNRITR